MRRVRQHHRHRQVPLNRPLKKVVMMFCASSAGLVVQGGAQLSHGSLVDGATMIAGSVVLAGCARFVYMAGVIPIDDHAKRPDVRG